MKISTIVIIQPFERVYSLSLIDFLCKALPTFGIHDIEVMYGYFWGNDIFNWKTRKVALNSILEEISQFENQNFGKIGDDDLIITIASHNLEITLCHETDIHVEFDVITPLVEPILQFLYTSFLKIIQEKQPFTSIVFFSDKPTFLVTSKLLTNELRSTKINLEQWNKTLECSPKESLEITGYGSQPGLLEIEQNDDIIKVKSWYSSNIQVHCDQQLLLDTKQLPENGVV